MHSDILNAIDQVIQTHQEIKGDNPERFGFIQGLKVARQLVLGTEEFVKNEVPYEALEEILQILRQNLDKDEVLEIIEDVYTEES